MKKYWIIENGNPIGPFSLSELRERNYTSADLPVWFAELADWSTIGQVPELAVLLEEEKEEEEPAVAPEVKMPRTFIAAAPDEINGIARPKTYMAWNIAALLCCCLPMAVVGLIFSSQVTQKWMRGDAAGAVKASEYAQWAFILSFTLGLVLWPFQLLLI